MLHRANLFPCAKLLSAILVCAAGTQSIAVSRSTQVAWPTAAVPTNIDRAFPHTRAADKPLLLYGSAAWCPPCNQRKATLFNRQDFPALSKSFVAVLIDGDRPGAQKLGRRVKVGGYPAQVLFKPDGIEITHLPGEANDEQVLDLLRLGLAGGRPATLMLADV